MAPPEGHQLRRYRSALQRWGLRTTPPFRIEPPLDDARQLARLFTGRATELGRSVLPLYNGRNILVRGALGVGKSAFLLRLLHELAAQARTVGERLHPIYISRFSGGTTDDFYRLVLFALAEALAEHDEEAKRVLEALQGLRVTTGRSRGLSGRVGVRLFEVAEAQVEVQTGRESTQQVTLENPSALVERLIPRAARRHGRLVIAVDDLDKARPENLRQVQAMLQGALPLLRDYRIGFILTGVSLPLPQLAAFDLYGSMLGLFDERIELLPLASAELCQIGLKTLNLARRPERPDAHPFAATALAEAAARSHGFPRLFNLICAKTLEEAALRELATIDDPGFATCYEAIQRTVAAEVTPQMRAFLGVALRYGGFSPEMPDEALGRLGFDAFMELMPIAEHLVAESLMVREEYPGGVRYVIADIASRAAMEPPDPAAGETPALPGPSAP